MLEIIFSGKDGSPYGIDVEGPLVVMPYIDRHEAERTAQQLSQRAGVQGTLLCVEDVARLGFIATANAVFQSSSSKFFGYTAQDAFAGRDWLSIAVNALAEGRGGLAAFNDGKWHGKLAAFGLVDREWATSVYEGPLFYPGYNRHYADVELSLVAMQQRKFRYDPNAVLIELDWQKDGKGVSQRDRSLFRQRREHGFDDRVPNIQLQRLFD